MVAKTDDIGAALFDFEDTAASLRCLDQLRECLRSQDPELLFHFLQHNHFCVEGLLVLAEYHRGRSAHEEAFQLVRRATYAVECCFNNAFSPFQATAVGPESLRPRVRLRLPKVVPSSAPDHREPAAVAGFDDKEAMTWPGWSWLRSLWMYTHCLASQGMHRSALETCKLLLSATLPRDPCFMLPLFDALCLRAKQYDAISRAAASVVPQYGLCCGNASALVDLDLILPNFAYSIALAGFLKANASSGGPPDLALLNEVSVADVIPQVLGSGNGTGIVTTSEGGISLGSAPVGAEIHARMMRAMLLFPLTLRPLLEEAGAKLYSSAPGGSLSRETWADLSAKPPFSDAADYRHGRHAGAHGRLCGAYAKRCGPLWRPELVLRWLHACAARLVSMHASPLFAAELTAARRAWTSAELALEQALAGDFADISPDLVGSEAPPMPPVLERAAQARLHPPREEEARHGDGDVRGAFGMGRRFGRDVPPTISLHSPPLVVFFQSLLPWGELDRSGLQLEPVRWSGLCHGAVQIGRGSVWFVVALCCDISRLIVSACRHLRARAQ